jgi:hypothetical protein
VMVVTYRAHAPDPENSRTAKFWGPWDFPGRPPRACGGSGFVFGVGSIPEFDLFHDAFVGLVCGFNAVPAFAAFGRNHLHDRVDDSSLAWRGVTDPLTNSEFMISHGKAPFRLLQQFAR